VSEFQSRNQKHNGCSATLLPEMYLGCIPLLLDRYLAAVPGPDRSIPD
jgi:hypothetical protein